MGRYVYASAHCSLPGESDTGSGLDPSGQWSGFLASSGIHLWVQLIIQVKSSRSINKSRCGDLSWFFSHRHWLLTWWVDSDKTCHCRSMQGAKNLAASPLTMRLVRVKVATPEGRQGTWLHAWLHGPPLPIGESSDFFGSFWKKVTLMDLFYGQPDWKWKRKRKTLENAMGSGGKGGEKKICVFFFVPWNLGHFMLCHWGGPLYLYVYSFTSKTTSAPKKTLEDDSVFERSMNNFFLAFGAAGRRVVYNTNACLRKWGRDFILQTTQRKIRQKHLSSSSRPSVLPCCPRKRWGAKWGLNGYVPVV